MPPLDEELEDTTSSNVSDLDGQQPADEPKGEGAQGTDTAESSAATGEEDSGLLSVVRDVVDKNRKPEATSPTEGEEDGDQGDKPAKAQDNEEYSDVPFRKHPRFQHLVRERNAFKEDATRYHNVVGFLDQHGLAADEAADGLIVFALAKTDPAQAWELAKPWVQKLLIAAGEVLPDELQQRVQAGELSREAALELSRANASTQSMRAAQTFRERQAGRRQQQELSNAITGAAISWETERQRRDPNFAAKMPALQKEIAWLQASEGKPTTPEGVTAQLNKAYKAVNAATPVQPQVRRQPTPRPAGSGQVAGNARPSEMTTLEIVRANRRSA